MVCSSPDFGVTVISAPPPGVPLVPPLPPPVGPQSVWFSVQPELPPPTANTGAAVATTIAAITAATANTKSMRLIDAPSFLVVEVAGCTTGSLRPLGALHSGRN